MPYFTENFESYPLGPFSSADWTPVFFIPTIETGGNFGTKCLQLLIDGIHRVDENDFFDEFSLFYALKSDHNSAFTPNAFLQLGNRDPNPLAVGTTNLFELFVGIDGTISVVCGGIFATNTELTIDRDVWHFFQINLKFRGVGFPAKVAVDFELVMNSDLVANGSQGTPIFVSGLFNGFPSVNRFQWNCTTTFGFIDDIFLNARRANNDYPFPGTPSARASQLATEPLQLPSTATGRAGQLVVEWNKLPDYEKVRISQMVIELPYTKFVGAGGWRVKEA